MQKLCKLLGRDEPQKGDVGIEIEVEGANLKAVDNKWWKTEDDGSLRGTFPNTRAEYIIKGVIDFAQSGEVLANLAEELEGAKFAFSFRTSVHVHLNVQDLTHAQLCNLIYTYFLLEEPLLNFCGEGRKANRFCLRLRDAEATSAMVAGVFNSEDNLSRIAPDNFRYASLNLEAFRKYGSIEFRSMRGTMDLEILGTWLGLIQDLKAYAIASDTPKTIHDSFRKLGANKFINSVLTGELAEAVRFPGMEGFMNESYSLAFDLPGAYIPAKERVFVADGWQVVGSGLASDWEMDNMGNANREDYDYWIREARVARAMEFLDGVRAKRLKAAAPIKKPAIRDVIEQAVVVNALRNQILPIPPVARGWEPLGYDDIDEEDLLD